MPSKTRKAAVEALSSPGGTPISGQPLGREAFMFRFNDLLKRIEKAAPHKAARELEHRIAEGTRKIAAARGKAAGADIARAEETLGGLKRDLVALNRDYITPHAVYHMVHYLLDLHDRQGWPITGNGRITIDLPGVVAISVEVPAEIPF